MPSNTNAYLFFPIGNRGVHPMGESSIGGISGGIQLTGEWSFSVENKLNIGAHTGGIGSGKAEFLEFTAKHQFDKASTDLFAGCTPGIAFQGVYLSLMKSSGSKSGSNMETEFVRWTFNGFGIQKIEWAAGDDAPEETITFRFGACKMEYKRQDPQSGDLIVAGTAEWSQVQNNNTMLIATAV